MAISRFLLTLLCTSTFASSLLVRAVKGFYSNPVIPNADTPDPGVAYDPVSKLYWVANTGGDGGDACFALQSSPDLATWTPRGYAFPTRPSWISNSCWAPELHFINGTWVMYYVGRAATTGLLSVGVAVSLNGAIHGPYIDPNDAPLVQDTGSHAQGQIDPTFAIDQVTGMNYLIWKTDGNADGLHTPIRIHALSPNGTTLAPKMGDWHTTQLITNDLDWEGSIVEAPWVVFHSSTYFLFYSANGYGGPYAVSVARSSNLAGPYVKLGVPILRNATESSPPFQAPGHCSVIDAIDGTTVMIYHAWTGDERAQRHVMIDAIQWNGKSGGFNDWPALANGGVSPSVGQTPIP
jgi:arabinan endo-1,5-alpha-L-arabinosidase